MYTVREHKWGSHMRENILEALTGTVVLVLAGVLLSYAYMREKKDTFHGYPLMVYFEKVDGLSVGSDVKMGGLKIGRVESMTLDSDTYEPTVKILIKNGISLPKDTSAAILSESLLGGKYLSLTAGGDEERLQPGDRISHAQSSVILESLIGQMIFNNKDKDKERTSKESPSTPSMTPEKEDEDVL